MKVGYLTDIGKKRTSNEDAIKVLEDKNICMLADGVGGNRSGEIASKTSLDALEKFIRHNPPEWLVDQDEIFRYFRMATNYVNSFIARLSEAKERYFGMATTLCFTYVHDGKIYVANIGDSRVYLIHRDSIEQITEDHTYVNDLVKMGAITREEASTHARKNVITRAIGANANNEVDCFCVPVEKGDKVLLCSDGLYDELNDEEILARVNNSDDMVTVAQDLVNVANENGGHDNVSVVCFSVED